MIFHVGMTVLIWNGFLRKRAASYLILAIVCHGLFNSLPIFVGIKASYLLMTLVTLGLVAFIRRSGKLRMRGFGYEEV